MKVIVNMSSFGGKPTRKRMFALGCIDTLYLPNQCTLSFTCWYTFIMYTNLFKVGSETSSYNFINHSRHFAPDGIHRQECLALLYIQCTAILDFFHMLVEILELHLYFATRGRFQTDKLSTTLLNLIELYYYPTVATNEISRR